MAYSTEASVWTFLTTTALVCNMGTTVSRNFRSFMGPVLGEYSGDFWVGSAIAAGAIGTQFISNKLGQEKLGTIISINVMILGIVALLLNEYIGLGGGSPELPDAYAGLIGLLVTLKMFEAVSTIPHPEGPISQIISHCQVSSK